MVKLPMHCTDLLVPTASVMIFGRLLRCEADWCGARLIGVMVEPCSKGPAHWLVGWLAGVILPCCFACPALICIP